MHKTSNNPPPRARITERKKKAHTHTNAQARTPQRTKNAHSRSPASGGAMKLAFVCAARATRSVGIYDTLCVRAAVPACQRFFFGRFLFIRLMRARLARQRRASVKAQTHDAAPSVMDITRSAAGCAGVAAAGRYLCVCLCGIQISNIGERARRMLYDSR